MSKNFKNALQEYLQKRGWPLPTYHTTQLCVQDGNVPVWQSRVVFANGFDLELQAESGLVSGKKIDAEQEAARRGWAQLLFQDSLNWTKYSDNQAPPCMIDAAPSAHVITGNPVHIDKIVYIDADHISFVDAAICQAHPTVEFRFYFAHGANLPHVHAACENAPGNALAFEASAPIKNLADTMILIDVARDESLAPSLIVSRDKSLYNASVLLENVDFASTSDAVCDWLHS